MLSYDVFIMELLPGQTLRQKAESLEKMINLLTVIAYPKRGTNEENLTIQDIAEQAQKLLPLPQ